MGLRQEQVIFARHVQLLLAKAFELGFEVTLGEALRPIEMQRLYVQRGASKTMKSSHIEKLAIDLNLFKEGALCTVDQVRPLGKWWEGLDSHNRWGGSWRGLVEAKKSSFLDSPHFERYV